MFWGMFARTTCVLAVWEVALRWPKCILRRPARSPVFGQRVVAFAFSALVLFCIWQAVSITHDDGLIAIAIKVLLGKLSLGQSQQLWFHVWGRKCVPMAGGRADNPQHHVCVLRHLQLAFCSTGASFCFIRLLVSWFATPCLVSWFCMGRCWRSKCSPHILAFLQCRCTSLRRHS